METVSYPLRVPKEILSLAKLRASEEHLDQSTALRQLMYLGAEEYVLSLVERSRISIGKAAELLETGVSDLLELSEKHGIRLGATAEQQRQSRQTARELIKNNRR